MKRLSLIMGALLLLLSACVSANSNDYENVQLHILAVNDIHAQIDNFPRLAYVVDSLRALWPNLLLVTSGDNQTGNPINDQYSQKGIPVIELMNTLGFDVSAVGNHEFDLKLEGLANTIDVAEFPFVCANVRTPSPIGIKPYVFIDTPEGVKVGFTSAVILNRDGIPDTSPLNVNDFHFSDALEALESMSYLKDSCDLLIYLTHIGYDKDLELCSSLDSSDVPIILGGHSHTLVSEYEKHNGIVLTQQENKLKYLTHLTVTMSKDGPSVTTQLITIGKDGAVSQTVAQMVEQYYSTSPLNKEIARNPYNLGKEQIGYLMVDALRSERRTNFAICNPGGVRSDSLEAGAVTLADVYKADPFGNEVVEFYLTPQEMRAMLTYAYTWDENNPIVPSGFNVKYVFDSNGGLSNVELFMPNGEPLNENKKYSIAMNDYVAVSYKFESEDKGKNLFVQTAQILIDYLQKRGTIDDYRNEKRVTIERL